MYLLKSRIRYNAKKDTCVTQGTRSSFTLVLLIALLIMNVRTAPKKSYPDTVVKDVISSTAMNAGKLNAQKIPVQKGIHSYFTLMQNKKLIIYAISVEKKLLSRGMVDSIKIHNVILDFASPAPKACLNQLFRKLKKLSLIISTIASKIIL